MHDTPTRWYHVALFLLACSVVGWELGAGL